VDDLDPSLARAFVVEGSEAGDDLSGLAVGKPAGRPEVERAPGPTQRCRTVTRELEVDLGSVPVGGILRLPPGATGMVLFAHGTGSGRRSPRNNAVAEVLEEGGLASLLVDLLTEEEEAADLRTGHLRFDIPFLAERLVLATRWLRQHRDTADLALGYFGASTGAAAALVAAAEHPGAIGAVVSRGGRPDMAERALERVRAPTLLIVGSLDTVVVDLNRQALAGLTCQKDLRVVEGASHLFEEPGTLEEASYLARDWFLRHLG
jgi:putative phosphoribosyl transferase